MQLVKIKNVPNSIKITSRVGQGMHLGPPFFWIFISDLHHKLKFFRFILFANDAKLVKGITCSSDKLSIQQDLYTIYEWCKSNGLFCKCFCISICKSSQTGECNVYTKLLDTKLIGWY